MIDKKIMFDAFLLPFFWLSAYVFITSAGFALAPFNKQSGVLAKNIFTWFWYGLAVIVGFLQIWNLIFPVTIYAWISLFPVAIFGLVKLIRTPAFKPVFPGYLMLSLWLFILIFIILASLDNTYIYDSRVYHFYSIKWINSYPVIPGMGNLFIYLGLNQSYFLYPAFLNSAWDSYRGVCSANGLLAIVIVSEIILTNAKLFTHKTRLSFSSGFQLLFLPLCINVGVQNLSSPTPDVLVNLLTFKVLSDLIRCLENPRVTFQDLFFLSFYALTGVIMKLSFAGIGLGVFLIVLWLLFMRKLWKKSLAIIASVLFLILLVPWVLRGVISSGYIGFPLSSIAMPVDWRIPKGNVESMAEYINGFARSHLHGEGAGAAANGYSWLSKWLIRMFSSIAFVLPLLLFSGISVLLKIKKIPFSKLRFVLIPVYVSIIFWFFTAPDIRFAIFSFWALGLAPLAYLISKSNMKSRNVLTCIYICAIIITARNLNRHPQPLGVLPEKAKYVFTTRSGLKINTVRSTSGEDNWEIDDCIIPCSVYPDSNLTLRRRDISGGFMIRDGK